MTDRERKRQPVKPQQEQQPASQGSDIHQGGNPANPASIEEFDAALAELKRDIAIITGEEPDGQA